MMKMDYLRFLPSMPDIFYKYWNLFFEYEKKINLLQFMAIYSIINSLEFIFFFLQIFPCKKTIKPSSSMILHYLLSQSN